MGTARTIQGVAESGEEIALQVALRWPYGDRERDCG